MFVKFKYGPKQSEGYSEALLSLKTLSSSVKLFENLTLYQNVVDCSAVGKTTSCTSRREGCLRCSDSKAATTTSSKRHC